jgi:hypothetical protein
MAERAKATRIVGYSSDVPGYFRISFEVDGLQSGDRDLQLLIPNRPVLQLLEALIKHKQSTIR